jgi:hypothetical protein
MKPHSRGRRGEGRTLEVVNALPHLSHLKGRSPVCVRMCVTSVPLLANALPHSRHLYGRSPAEPRHGSAAGRWGAFLQNRPPLVLSGHAASLTPY